jgi:hypothetical protein
MSNLFTTNVVASKSPISLDEAISSNPNNENIIFSIKNHEILHFTHTFDSGQFVDGPSKPSNATIRLEILDTSRIFDPRIVGVGEFKYVYFYYGVGDKNKDWTGPIAAVLDPSKITYGTFSDGKRTFILEFTAVFANFEDIPIQVQKDAQTNYKTTPLFRVTADKNGGSVEPIGDFHSKMETMLIDYVKTMTSPDSEVLVLFPDFKKIYKRIQNNINNAAIVATPDDYKKYRWEGSHIAGFYIQLLSYYFGLTCTQVLSDNKPNTQPIDQVQGTVKGADPGEGGRQGMEKASSDSEGKSLEIHGFFDKKDASLLEALQLFFSSSKIGPLYSNPGGLHFTIENHIPYVKALSKIKKKNCPISGNKPVVVVGDRNLVLAFIYGMGGDTKNLSDEDKGIFTYQFITGMQKEFSIDVTDTIFDDKDSKDSKIPVFKVGAGDPNVLDFKININPNLYWMLTRVWAAIASTQNISKNIKDNKTNDKLLVKVDAIEKMKKAFNSLIASVFNKYLGTGFLETENKLTEEIVTIYYELIADTSVSVDDPWRNILIFQSPFLITDKANIENLPQVFASQIQALVYDGTIKTPPFFKFNTPMALTQGCYFKYSDPVYTANEEASKLAEAFTGKYFIKGFRHTISSGGAYSEFTIQKLIQTNEAQIFNT